MHKPANQTILQVAEEKGEETKQNKTKQNKKRKMKKRHSDHGAEMDIVNVRRNGRYPKDNTERGKTKITTRDKNQNKPNRTETHGQHF